MKFLEVYLAEDVATHLLAEGSTETVCGKDYSRSAKGMTFNEEKVLRWLPEQDWGCHYCARCLTLTTGWALEDIEAWKTI